MNESFWIIPLFQNLKNEMSALSLSLALIFFIIHKVVCTKLESLYYIAIKN